MEHVSVEVLCSFRTLAVRRNGTIRQAVDESATARAKELTVAITELRGIVPGWNSGGGTQAACPGRVQGLEQVGLVADLFRGAHRVQHFRDDLRRPSAADV